MYRRIRLHRNRAHRWVRLLQSSHHAGKRATRSQARNKVSYSSFGLLPDFATGAFVMRAPVGVVIILIRVEIFCSIARGHLASDRLRAVRALQRICFNNFRAVNSQNALALFARVRRQTERHRISARGPQHGISDSGISTRRVQNDFAWIKSAAALSLENHRQSGAVFNGSSRIHMLSFDEDLDASRKLTGHTTQAKQGRTADLRFQIVKVTATLSLKGALYFRFGNHVDPKTEPAANS